MLAGVHYAEIGWGLQVGAEGEEGAERTYGGIRRDCEGNCWGTVLAGCFCTMMHLTMQAVPRLGTKAEGVLLLPETVLMKICIVSSVSELELLILEMLDVRRMVALLEGTMGMRC
jgi:hypothetical protein